MVLHTIIGEYDVLYAQTREMSCLEEKSLPAKPQAVLSTNPNDFLAGTALNVPAQYTNYK